MGEMAIGVPEVSNLAHNKMDKNEAKLLVKNSESDLISLNLIYDYPVRWSKYKVLRDFVQNFYDAVGYHDWHYRFSYEYKDDKLLLKTIDVDFGYDWLIHIGASTKRGAVGQYAGYFGEGFKIASLCALRDHGWNIEVVSRDWKLIVITTKVKVDGRYLTSLAYRVWRIKQKHKGTMLCISPFSLKDNEILKCVLMSFFIRVIHSLGKRYGAPRKGRFFIVLLIPSLMVTPLLMMPMEMELFLQVFKPWVPLNIP